MGKIIAITTPKGKVGKTTTAINLAVAFALSGKKTLLIDLDPAGSCASGLGLSKEEVANKLFDDDDNEEKEVEKKIRTSEIRELVKLDKDVLVEEIELCEEPKSILEKLLKDGEL